MQPNTTTDSEQQLNSPTPSADTVVFNLQLDDSALLTLVHKPITDSEDYWQNTFGLKKVRSSNLNLWLPNHWKNKEVYDYQEDYLYQDPRIFVSVETICATVNARIPSPEVMPAQDGVISQQLASDLQKVCYAHSEMYRVNDLFAIATRSHLLKREGYVKLRYDPSVGEHGDVVPEFVAPEDLVVDMDARFGETPRFVAQKLRNRTMEELMTLFPDNQSGVKQLFGLALNAKPTPQQLGVKRNIWEVWFRYYDPDKESYGGGLAWVDDKFQFVLGKMRNPNFNYEDQYAKGKCSNLLDNPEPPFFGINSLNDGSSFIDLTSLVEQAATMQRILDKRGFQIVENADMAGSGLIFNTNMIKKEDVAKLIGAPDERIGVKGDVRAAVQRLPVPQLPQYVLEDKLDARAEIADIFATHDITRGQQSASKTLGQDVLQQNQDNGRMGATAKAVERMATKYYRYLVQMFKVYYTDEHWFKAVGEDGQFDRVMMKGDRIEDGVDIRVEAGSTMPVNKESQLQFVTELAPMGLVDPLTLYEVGAGSPLPSPKKMLERLLQFRTDPLGFMGKVQDEEFDRDAFMDIQLLLAGQMPKIRDEISPEYLSFFNKYMTSGTYIQTPDNIKAIFNVWLAKCQLQGRAQLQALMTQQDMPQQPPAGMSPGAPGAPPDPNAPPGAPQPGQPPQGAPAGMPPGAPPQGMPPPPPAAMPQPQPSYAAAPAG